MKTTRRRKQAIDNTADDSAEETVKIIPSSPRAPGLEPKVVDDWISVSLDVFKGMFIVFMLTEHTRSALSIGMSPNEPIMKFVSQVACSLDMTSFSAAYGFSAYRAYLTNSKNRPFREQLQRMLRSVGLIVVASWLSNFHFEMAVLRNPVTLHMVFRMLTFEMLYWDFLATFPALLLLGFLTTKPLMRKFTTSSPMKRLGLAVVLLGWPLLVANFPLEICNTALRRYGAIFMGCVSRSFGAMRFSAFTYMFFFNFGCIVSQILLEWVEQAKTSSKLVHIPSLKSVLKTPLGLGYLLLLLVELYFAVQMLGMYHRSWEYINFQGYRRFPMSTKVMLAWGFFSQSVWVMAVALVAVMRHGIMRDGFKVHEKIPGWIKKFAHWNLHMLEQFGANVLLYLVVSNFTIQGLFHVDWNRHYGPSKHEDDHEKYSTREWEIMVVVVALGQIALVQLIRYLVSSARK